MTRARDLADSADLAFDGDTLKIDSANNRVGIGTTSPVTQLHNSAASGTLQTRTSVTGSTASDVAEVAVSTGSRTYLMQSKGSSGDFVIRDSTGAADRVTLTAGGNVGIGTSSPSTYDSRSNNLVVGDSGDAGVTIFSGATSNARLQFAPSGSTGLDNGLIDYDNNNDSMSFATGGSDRMRIDSIGNLLVGTTSTGAATASNGAYITPDGQIIGRSDGIVSYLNRRSTDGQILQFMKDGTTVGSIGVANNDIPFITCAEGTAGLRFDGDNNNIKPSNASGANLDNTTDLGSGGVRFGNIYAANGTIQTSDQNEKQQITSLTSAEITAAKAISKLFKTFKWNDSVAAKGANARIHTGVIAQQIETAMTDAGLDAGDYGFFISADWYVDANGDEVEADAVGAIAKNRKGIRYPQLLAFVGAATEQRLADIETRLTALEGN